MIVIGICGPAGSGKSYAAHRLTSRHGYRRLRFAEPLKAMLRALGCSNEELDGALKESPCAGLCGRTPREAMQSLGTEWGRQLVHPDLWLEAWRRDIAQIAEFAPAARVVVDDVRFLNEASEIWRRGGRIVRVDRADASAGETAAAAHMSESIPFGCDARLENTGDERFGWAIDAWLERAGLAG